MLDRPSSNAASDTNGKPPLSPKLSVGLPVYNGAEWIEEAIKSILGQSMSDLELIIADNASTDRTEAICRDAAARDARVRYHRNSNNIGLYRNFDLVFELAAGTYFKWAACSDVCLDGFFEKCVAVLDARPDVVLVYPKTYLLLTGADGKNYAQEYEDDLNIEDDQPSKRFSTYLNRERLNNVMHGVIRASALRRTSLIRPMPGSDISMIAELSFLGKFVEIPDRLFVRRFDPETSSILMDASTAAERSIPGAPTLLQRIDLHTYRFVTTFRAPISFPEKLRAWFYLLRRLVALRHQVIRKLIQIAKLGR